jgi:hypothetical protein
MVPELGEPTTAAAHRYLALGKLALDLRYRAS